MDLSELLQSKAAIERQIAELQLQQRSAAISKVRELMTLHGLTVADLTPPSRAPRQASEALRAPVRIKYRDESGNQWTGRGLKPKWLTQAISQGKRQEDFLI